MTSLLDELKQAAELVDPQFQPSSNEVAGVLAALVYFTEHGQEFLKAVEGGAEKVTELLAPPAPEPQPAEQAPAAPAADAGSLSPEELQAMISDLQAQLTSRQATAQQTQVQHETGPGQTEQSAG